MITFQSRAEHLAYEIAKLVAAEAYIENACAEISRAALSQDIRLQGTGKAPAWDLWEKAFGASCAISRARKLLDEELDRFQVGGEVAA